MSETIAVALIVAFSGLAGSCVGWLLERSRRTHDREMRLLEWKRQDRLERLAPIRDYLDTFSRATRNLGASLRLLEALRASRASPDAVEAVEQEVDERIADLNRVLQESGHAIMRSSDVRLTGLVAELFVTARDEDLATKEAEQKLGRGTRQAWDRLEELQSDL